MEIQKIWFDENAIFIATKEGIEKSMPLHWFPSLEKATAQQRNQYSLSPFGIHWEELDEDLSFEGFFKFKENKLKTH